MGFDGPPYLLAHALNEGVVAERAIVRIGDAVEGALGVPQSS
jgi:hypothetical protein